MVHRELKQVVVRREPEEPGPEDRPLREIERSPSLLDQQGLYRGETLLVVTLEATGPELIARVGRETSLRPGDRTTIHLDATALHLFDPDTTKVVART